MNPAALSSVRKDVEEVLTGGAQEALSSLKGGSILITGGTGFMGSWLVETLAVLNDKFGYGIKVRLLAKHASQFRARASHLAERKDVELVDRNVTNIIELDGDVSHIIHAAANPDNRLHASDPLRVMNVIYKGTESALAAASRLGGLKKFMNISSGLVYGPQPLDLEAVPEDFSGGPDCASIMSVYPEAKRCAETLCAVYRNQFKMPVVTARPFAFIGPYQLLDKPWAVNNFISDALRGAPINILGDEKTVRSYMYPSDMAFWLLRILAAGESGRAYNVGSPCAVTLAELAAKVASNFTPQPEIVLASKSSRPARRSRFVPDVKAAENLLGLKIRVGIDEAVRKTLLWHEALKKAGKN
jgi:dTDP-glucose 4,6-dehydratase